MSELDDLNTEIATKKCRYCKHTGAIRIEVRTELQPKSLGTFSLAGEGVKVTVQVKQWLWAVCRPDLDGCGNESRGKFYPDC